MSLSAIAFLGLASLLYATSPDLYAAYPAFGSQLKQQFSLPDNGISPGDGFGSVIAIDGTTAVVGAPGDSLVGNNDAGSAYVFVQAAQTWAEQVKLRASDAATSVRFGAHVAISGGTLAVTALPQYAGTGSFGAVYVFVGSGNSWSQQARIDSSALPVGLSYYGTFPTAIALSGSTLVISTTNGYNGGDAAFVFVRTGTTWQWQATLQGSPNQPGFGASLAVSGDTVVVGNPQAVISNHYNSGAAYVFTRAAGVWTQQAMLTASDGATYANFGSSVAIIADTVLVGASGSSKGYVFDRAGTTWSQTTELVQPATQYGQSNFGATVALSGTTAVLGSTSTLYYPGPVAGVFAKTGSLWSHRFDLVPPANETGYYYSVIVPGGLAINGSTILFGKSYPTYPSPSPVNELDAYSSTGGGADGVKVVVPLSTGVQLGASVAVQGSIAVVGAPGDTDAQGVLAGSVRVLASVAGVWSVQAVLTPSDGVQGGRFGQSVALDGDVLVVGAMNAAYVFVQSNGTWSQTAILKASDGVAGDGFGSSLAVLGHTILVGAPGNNGGTGQAYVFINSGSGWAQAAELAPPDLVAGGRFGTAVALTQNMAIVSATQSYPYASNMVFVFQGGGNLWLRTQKLQQADHNTAFGTAMAVSGNTLLVAGGFIDPVTSNNIAGAYGYQWKSGRWQGGDLWISASTPGGSFAGLALDGGLAMASIFTTVQTAQTFLFAQRGAGWTQVDQLPGGACAISGSTFLIGNTNTDNSAPKSGSASFYAPAAEIAVFDGTDPAAPEIDYTQPVDLGALVVGTSYLHHFTIRNKGLEVLTGLEASVTGANASSITITPLHTTSLAPGAAMVLTFSTVPWEDGLAASIVIQSNDPNKGSLVVPLTAEPTDNGVAPVFISDAGLGFALNDPVSSLAKVMLSVQPTGSLPLTLQWRHDGIVIPGATGSTLDLGAPRSGLVGKYTAEVFNPYGHAITQAASLFWVLPAKPVLNLALNEGAPLVLHAGLSGPAVVSWQLSSPIFDSYLADDGRISGSSTGRLQILRLTPGDAGTYSFVYGSSSVMVANVAVRAKPRLDLGALPPLSTFNWHVSSAVFGGPFFLGDGSTRFTAMGLPPGVTLDPVSGILGGRPTRAGSYSAYVSAANAAGAFPGTTLTINVTPLDANLVGPHVGLIDPDPAINGSLGGTVTIEVSSNGAVTGWASLGSQMYRFIGHFANNPDTSVPSLFCNISLGMLRNGKVLSLEFTESDIITGDVVLADAASTQRVAFVTVRQRASSLVTPAIAGAYNAVLTLSGPLNPALPAPPGGSGWLQIKAAGTGFTFSGRTGDGVTITGSSPVLQDVDGQFAIPVHQLLYLATGSLHGWMTLHSDSTVDGTLKWWKDTIPHRGGTSWPGGFSPTQVTVAGDKYLPPARGQRMAGLSAGTVAFDHSVLPALAVDSDFTFTLGTTNVPALTLVAGNALHPALSFNAATGFFSGSIDIVTPSSSAQAAFSGVLAGNLGNNVGTGYFLVPPPAVPAGQPSANIISGMVHIHH